MGNDRLEYVVRLVGGFGSNTAPRGFLRNRAMRDRILLLDNYCTFGLLGVRHSGCWDGKIKGELGTAATSSRLYCQ